MRNAVSANAVLLFSIVLALLMLLLCLPLSGWTVAMPLHVSLGWWRQYAGHVDYLFSRTPADINALAYERPGLAAGQYWRLLTGHLIHLNMHHALMNSAALVMLGLYFRHDFSLPAWAGLILLSCLSISLGLWWGQPQLMAYVGFSGVLHALLYAGVIRTWKEMPRINSVVLALLFGRLVWEHSALYNPAYLMGWIHGLVAPAAHLYGALTGLAWGLLSLWRRPDPAPPVAA